MESSIWVAVITGLARQVTFADDHLLDVRNLLSRNLHAHVAAGYHDAVAGLDDGIQIFNTLCVLDLSR